MQTDFGSLTTQQKKVWSANVLAAGRDTSFWLGDNGFLSSGLKDATKPIHFVDELTATERGSKAVMPLVLDLVKDGTAGDNDLEGNEEALIADDIEIQIDQLRHAVKNKGRMSEQKTVIKFRLQAKDKLAYWWASKNDEMAFLTAAGMAYTKNLDGSTRSASQLPTLAFAADVSAPSTNRVAYAGTATGTSSLTASDKMSWNLLVRNKAFAERKRLKPVRINGKNTYIVVMSPEQARDLVLDPDYKAIVAQASDRGKNNELFTGAFAQVHGLVLFSHAKIPTTQGLTSGNKYGAAGTVEGAQALFLGAQSLGYARIGAADWEESDNTDYKNKTGLAYGAMIGWIKAKFKSIFDSGLSEDFSTIAIYTAAAV